ncbi:hypothetical protein B0H14DRAFT_3134944 [Mycena olivaceomarginata]|nr:hypothetical protein B0H14DRAFT_3134944 [Mycena olivaceomarginata]
MYRTAPLWSWRNAAVEDVAGGGRSDAYEDFLSGKKDSTHVIVEARMDPFIPSLLLLFPASFHFSIADLKTWSARMCLAAQQARRSPRQKPSPPDQEPQLRRSDERRDAPASRPHSHCPLGLCKAHSFITNGGPTWAKENTRPVEVGARQARIGARRHVWAGLLGKGDWEEGSSQLHVPSRVAVPEDDEVQAMRLRTCYSLWFDTTANLRRIVSM